jgi:hypothetical protein
MKEVKFVALYYSTPSLNTNLDLPQYLCGFSSMQGKRRNIPVTNGTNYLKDFWEI